VDVESAVDNMKIASSNAIKTVYEAVVNSIQSCRSDDTEHTISVEILSFNRTIDGKSSSHVDGFKIIDDGAGFNDDNYRSFCTIGSRLKKAKFGCKGVGRLSWLKVFRNVEVESTYCLEGVSYRRSFTFNLKDKDVLGGEKPERLEESVPNKTVVKISGCYDGYQKYIQVTAKGLASGISSHCISSYLDLKKSVPLIKVIHGDDPPEIVNEIWESTVSDKDHDSVTVKNRVFNITHVKFYKSFDLKNGISLCADGLEVKSFERFPQDLIDEDDRKFRYRCFVSGELLDSTVNISRDGFDLGTSLSVIDDFTDPTVDDIIKAVTPLSEDYLKLYTDSYNDRCRDVLRSFMDTDIGKSFSSVVKYSPNLIASITPDMTPEQMHKLMSDEYQKIESELLFSRSISKKDKVRTSEAVEERMVRINDLHRDELTRLFVHRGLVLSVFDERLESLNRFYPDKGEEYEMELESIIHDLLLPQGTDAKNVPTLSNCNLWILDERLNTYAFQGAYSNQRICKISDSPSEDVPDVVVFGDIRDNMNAESICIIELKRPNRADTGIIDQINRYISAFIGHKIKNYRNEGISVDDKTTFYCYAVCNTNSPGFDDKMRFLNMNKKFGGRGYYLWNSNVGASYDVIDHHQLFADAKIRNKVFFELIGMEVGADTVIVTKGEQLEVRLNDE
jgi:hypothetical protein